jgi:hypothetical protein
MSNQPIIDDKFICDKCGKETLILIEEQVTPSCAHWTYECTNEECGNLYTVSA